MKLPILALSVGKPKDLPFKNTQIYTGINKEKVDRPVFLGKTNFEGDAQGDLKNHGGPDKAVCVYCHRNFTYWNDVQQLGLTAGAFGENLTIAEATESDIQIGDVFQLDEAIVQVSQPRKPCYKVAAKNGFKHLPKMMEDTGYTGFYLRVIKEGQVHPHSEMVLIEKAKNSLSVKEVNHLYFHQRDDRHALQRIIDLENLAPQWREMVNNKLNRLH